MKGVRVTIGAAGASFLFLPQYCPDFNPIEMVFSKLKALFEKRSARTVEQLSETLADAIEISPSAELRELLRCRRI